MILKIKFARTADEIDQVFRLRYLVLHGDGYIAARSDQRVYDRFDTYPSTSTFIAKCNDQIIGTCRVMLDEGLATSVDEFYDFTPHIPSSCLKLAAGSHFYIQREYRSRFGLSNLLMGMFHYWCQCMQVTHVKGVMNSTVVSFMQRNGYLVLDQPLKHEGLPFVPVLLDMQDLKGSSLEFVNAQEDGAAEVRFERCYEITG